MFASRFFPGRYFAPRYFPQAGAGTVSVDFVAAGPAALVWAVGGAWRLMAPSLSWVDDADGTGGVATITGVDSVTVTVYSQQVDATGLRSPTWTSAGTRSGNGTVDLTLAPGYYWLRADGTDAGLRAISNLVYAYATDSTDALASRCVDALAARLNGLLMATDIGVSVPNTAIYKVIMPAERGKFIFPCLILSHEANRESQPGTTNNKDDIEYPINIYICDVHGADFDTKRKIWLRWRQQVFRALRNQRLAGITESLTTRLEPMLVFDPKMPAFQNVITGFVARCLVREMRGT